MQSAFKSIFIEIQNRLKNEVPELKYIDRNLAQYQQEDFRKSMIFPSVLIKFENTDYSELSDGGQIADKSVIKIMLFAENWNATTHFTPNGIIESGLQFWDTEQKVFEALQNFSKPELFTPLIRISHKDKCDNDLGLNAVEITFTTSWIDRTLPKEQNTIRLGVRGEQ